MAILSVKKRKGKKKKSTFLFKKRNLEFKGHFQTEIHKMDCEVPIFGLHTLKLTSFSHYGHPCNHYFPWYRKQNMDPTGEPRQGAEVLERLPEHVICEQKSLPPQVKDISVHTSHSYLKHMPWCVFFHGAWETTLCLFFFLKLVKVLWTKQTQFVSSSHVVDLPWKSRFFLMLTGYISTISFTALTLTYTPVILKPVSLAQIFLQLLEYSTPHRSPPSDRNF